MKNKGHWLSESDKELVEKICNERKVKLKTSQGYVNSVKCFEDCFNFPLTDKLDTYFKEEENVPWRKRTLRKDLISYRNHVQNKYSLGTVKVYFTRLTTLLKHLELEIHYLPPLNKKNCKWYEPITYKDLLTRDILACALSVASPLMKAIICFCSSSGCARRETLTLTVEDYLLANEVQDLDDVNVDFIPTFSVLRQKTGKYYFAYCTPQSNQYIYEYLLTRDDLKQTSKLFDVNLYYFNKYFNEINNLLDLGKVGKYNRFRSHMLRKYHASILYNNGMNIIDVDTLQGRSKDSTHRSYFMEDPRLLKRKYEGYVKYLTI